jgi:hypothetical protein
MRRQHALASDLAAALTQASVDPALEPRALQDALRAAIAARRGYCDWTRRPRRLAGLLGPPDTLGSAILTRLHSQLAELLGTYPTLRIARSPLGAADTSMLDATPPVALDHLLLPTPLSEVGPEVLVRGENTGANLVRPLLRLDSQPYALPSALQHRSRFRQAPRRTAS